MGGFLNEEDGGVEGYLRERRKAEKKRCMGGIGDGRERSM